VRVVDGTGARVLVHALIYQIHATAVVITEEVRDATMLSYLEARMTAWVKPLGLGKVGEGQLRAGRIVTVDKSQIVKAIWLRCSVS